MTTLTEQYRRHRAEALHTNIAPKGNSAMTDAQMRDLVLKTIDEKLGKPIREALELTKDFRQKFEKLQADIAEIEADQKAKGIYGLADRQKEMTANANYYNDTLPE